MQRRSEYFTTCTAVVLLGAINDVSKDLVNVWAAFGRFCTTRLGVSPETMLRAWQFPLEDFLETLRRYDKTKPDPKKVDEYFGYIRTQWDRRFRRGPGNEYVSSGDDESGDELDDDDGQGGGDDA